MLLLASTLGVMAGATIVPVLALIQNDLGVSGTAAGFIITTHGLTIALTSTLVGRVIDRFGVRLPLAAGLVLYGLGGGAGILTEGFPALIASRVALGLGAAVVFTGTTTAMLSLYQGPRRDRVMGWRTTATTVGGITWPLLAGALGGLSWHAAFTVYLIGVPLGVAVLFAIPKTRTPVQDRKNTGGIFKLLRSRPVLLGYAGLMIATGVMMYVPAVNLPKRLEEIGITSTILVSVYAVVGSGISASAVGLFYARIRARWSHAALLRVAVVGWSAGLAIYGTLEQPVLLLLAPIVIGIGHGLAMPSLTVLIGDNAPPELRGRATSLQGTAMFTGQFISPIIAGPLIAATSFTTGFLAAAGLGVVIVIVIILLKAKITTPDGESPDVEVLQAVPRRAA
ncbi:MAG: MFS transporter [Streptosporangiales bacterium]|nr:MFS transporter [Streptosporangiales bacterium]